MKRHLKIHIGNLFAEDDLPDHGNRRFWPSDHAINNAMGRAKRGLRKSMIDQESLLIKISEWKEANPCLKNNSIFFRPKGETSDCTVDGMKVDLGCLY